MAPQDKKKKTTPKKTAAKKTPVKRPARPTAKIIRNLRQVPVHLRLRGDGEKPYRIELKARGNHGDSSNVPAKCTQDATFARGLGVLFETITQTELNKIQYPPIGYAGSNVTIERMADTSRTIATLDADGNMHKIDPHVSMQTVDKPGSNTELTQQANPAVDSLVSKGVMPPLPKITKD